MPKDLNEILPEFEPKANLWSKIEQTLDFDDLLEAKIKDLPEFEPSIEWNRVLEEISVEKKLKTVKFPNFIRWGIAASVLLALGSVWLFNKKSDEGVISYSVEKQVEIKSDLQANVSTSESEAEEFINQQCEEVEVVCMKPEVKELRAELAELNLNQRDLETQIEQFGNDPALVQAQIKIENQKAQITKELINILRS
ncbi:hypothetical protein GCM10011514_47110 [Emticicia aquatilis]|uniref:Uncharacterized protein n=1 Tax=Emticicia aquatilis TaxID=1537369 RepID=A0A917DXS4_9BACT|nr:hypothetical protein [Emticicia aquatilis]GGD77752.1 hypothetical protein GCM10011514_47110 [Emticicia aquatilis]